MRRCYYIVATIFGWRAGSAFFTVGEQWIGRGTKLFVGSGEASGLAH